MPTIQPASLTSFAAEVRHHAVVHADRALAVLQVDRVADDDTEAADGGRLRDAAERADVGQHGAVPEEGAALAAGREVVAGQMTALAEPGRVGPRAQGQVDDGVAHAAVGGRRGLLRGQRRNAEAGCGQRGSDMEPESPPRGETA
jgi:hypothetical protein